MLFSNAKEGLHGKPGQISRIDYQTRLLVDPETGTLPFHMRRKELAFAKQLEQNSGELQRAASTLTWVHRGPYHVGGRTRACALDVTNENIIVAGSVSGGMYRSVDGGVSWIKTTSSAPGATAVVQDTRAGQTATWYYVSGEPYGTSASGTGAFYLGNGVYKSVDGGVSWDTLNATATNTPTTWDAPYDISWNIALNPKDLVNDVIYVAATSGVYKSIDGGANWTTARGTFSGSAGSYFTDVLVTPDSGIVYAALSKSNIGGGYGALHGGIWRSVDGSTWVNINPPFFSDSTERIKMCINPQNSSQLYFLAHTPDTGQLSTDYKGTPERNSLWRYDYVSGDGTGLGGTWTDLSMNIPHNLGQFGNFNAQGGYNLVIKVKPDDPNTVFIGGTNIFRSTSAFTDSLNTTQIGGYGIGTTYPDFNPYPNHHSDQHDILFLPSNPDVMINAADGGLYKTTDCMAASPVWVQLNTSYTTSQFYTLAVDKGTPGSNILIAGAQDNGSWWENSANPTNTWTFSAKGDGSYCYIQNGGGMYYYSRQLGEMIKCTLDGSGNATAFARIDPIGASGYDFINPYTIDPNNNNIMYLAAGTRVYRNSDLSAIPLTNQYDTISTNWSYFPDTVTTQVSALAVSTTPANRLYYGTSSKKMYRIDNAHTGSPSRTEITSTINPHSFPNANISSIAVDPYDADHVMVVFSNYSVQSVFVTRNGGTTWKKCGGNLEIPTSLGPSVRSCSILPVSDGTVYLLATSTGLYGTTWVDTTNTIWLPLATNEIGNTVSVYIETRLSDGLVVVATHGYGIFSTNITSVGQVGLNPLANKTTGAMLKIFPNPTSTYSNFIVKLNQNCEGEISLYNLSGKKIKNLYSGSFTKEEKTIHFNIEELPAGIYLCRLEAGKTHETSKLLIVK